jgi:hypothetical protein
MDSKKPKIFDGITIFLSFLLFALITIIITLIYLKETNIKAGFNYFNSAGEKKQSDQILKNDLIIVNFSGPIKPETVFNNLVFEPRLNFDYEFKNNHQLKIILKEHLMPDLIYKLKIKNFRGKWGFQNQGVEGTFSTYPLPKVEKTIPSNEAIEIKSDEILNFILDKSLAEQYFLKIKTEPEFKFEVVKSGNENKIAIKPVDHLKFDTDYKITAEVKNKNHFDFSRKIAEINFKTERPPTVVYGWNENGEPTKTDFRNDLLEPAIQVGRYIDIDLSNQNLYIFENGKELGAYKVSTGIRGMETPVGEFKVMARARRPWSATYGLFMPWFIQFTNQGHGIHELPEWPGGYKEGTNHLGIPVSHGCVRLGVGPAKNVYEFIEIGTPIVIHY